MAVCYVCGTDRKQNTSKLDISKGLPAPNELEICWKCQSEILQEMINKVMAPMAAMVINIINDKKNRRR